MRLFLEVEISSQSLYFWEQRGSCLYLQNLNVQLFTIHLLSWTKHALGWVFSIMELNAALVESSSQPCPLLFSWYKSEFVNLHVFSFHWMILRIPTWGLLHGENTPQGRPKPTGMNLTDPNNFFGQICLFLVDCWSSWLTCLPTSHPESPH